MTAKTMTITKAADLAEASGIAELIDAVNRATSAGWQVVDFDLTEDGGNVEVRPHTGVMVAWMLPEYLADRLRVEGGEQDLHVTLAYLGNTEDLTLEQQRLLVGVVSEVVQDQSVLYGVLAGTDTFEPSDSSDGQTPWYAQVNIPGLAEFRQKLVDALAEAGLPVDVTTHPDYTPHVTLAYLEDDAAPKVDLSPVQVDVDQITVCLGGDRRDLALVHPGWEGESEEAQAWWEARRAWYVSVGADEWGWLDTPSTPYRPFAKSVEQAERRFTLGPWYIPNTEDAHGDWTDPDELQAALWRYVDSGYRGIHIQHMPDVVAGRWVEAMTLPHETTWPVIDPNGNVASHTYPAGTVMLGVIWDEWAWELVKSGAISGYSIGGNANTAPADIPDGDGLALPPAGGVATPVSA